MTRRSRVQIRRRLRSLASLELVNIPLQAVVWFGVAGLEVTAANAAGFGLFSLLLLQGSGYWFAKLRQFEVAGSPLPGARILRFWRVADLPVLAAGLGFVGWTWWAGASPGQVLPGLVFGLFAVLEYVNYFHVQLMYDNAIDLRYLFAHGLRRAHLARDLLRTKAFADPASGEIVAGRRPRSYSTRSRSANSNGM